MADIKKWNIKGLRNNLRFSDSAPIILSSKLRKVMRLIDKYFKNDSSENLHDLRIAVRRFRYSMELFYDCFNHKRLFFVYEKSKILQDLLGECRDLDVLSEEIKNIESGIESNLPPDLFLKIEEDRIKKREIIKGELLKFKSNKSVNKFLINR